MYLYRNHSTNTYNWGHISSRDLLHWRHHHDCLTSENGDEGCFSGGAFLDDDGTAYLTFWKFAAPDGTDKSAIAIAKARPPYDEWERIYPLAIPASEWGIAETETDRGTVHAACADPSNIWKKDGWYYMQTGNLCVLNKYGRDDNSSREYQGDWVDLFKSKDLRRWRYVHRFYDNPNMGADDWPDRTEDDMCPSFLPLFDKKSGGRPTGKYLQLFIAHNRGAQYYIGHLEGEKFIPEQHGRFSWKDRMLFAPEALVDNRNRQIAWHWIHDGCPDNLEKYGWQCVYNFPRVLWYEDETLRMAPAEELDNLQFHPQTFDMGRLNGIKAVPVMNGASFRIRAAIDMKNASRAGFIVREDKQTGERVEILFDRDKKALLMDMTSVSSGYELNSICEEAPFDLKDGETLDLDIFVDRSIFEVYANERQAICRRAYHKNPKSATAVSAVSDGADFGFVSAWELDAANPY